MISNSSVQNLIRLALAEDIGRGDITTEAIIDENLKATATILIKQPAKVVGLPMIEAVFDALDRNVVVNYLARDGQDVSGERIAVCELKGPAKSILTGERTALNFLGRLTGIATLTREAVELLSGTKVKLLDTRKTTPGWRVLEKYAVKTGGGFNHRFGLDDMVLIKDNHIALCGSVEKAIELARTKVGLSQKIEVEVDTFEQLEEALETSADIILLDNMAPELLSKAVQLVNGRVPLEASGNMNLDKLAEVAKTGVDYISMGALTHSAVSVDVGLDIVFQ